MEEKINEALRECFSKISDAFEENGLEFSQETKDYIEELILKEIPE